MPSSPPQPALSLGIGSFIIRQRVAFQETVQDVRVRRLAHKDQGFGMRRFAYRRTRSPVRPRSAPIRR